MGAGGLTLVGWLGGWGRIATGHLQGLFSFKDMYLHKDLPPKKKLENGDYL